MPLTSYLTQLLADLRAMQDQREPVPNRLTYTPLDIELLYLPGGLCSPELSPDTTEQACAELFGIPAEAFPPPERLSPEQMAQLNEAIFNLCQAWGFRTHERPGAPPELTYRLLTRAWRKESFLFAPSQDNNNGPELCYYGPEDCAWGDYCTCRIQPDDQDEH